MVQNKKFLIIDDSEECSKAITDCIHNISDNFELMSCNNGIDGLRVAKQWKPDVIFLDYLMPKLDGLAVMSALKGSPLTQNIIIIMMSANIIDSKGCPFVKKPIQRRVIEELIYDSQKTQML